MAEFRAHVDAQVAALSQLTYRQWFTGRAVYLQAYTPASADMGEQAMRADYIADKAWWLLSNEPEQFATFDAAAQAATAELPAVSESWRSGRPGWLEDVDVVVTSTAGSVPSQQWGTTLIPLELTELYDQRDATPDHT